MLLMGLVFRAVCVTEHPPIVQLQDKVGLMII